MLNALLNLETYATTPDAAIAQISVSYFDLMNGEFINHKEFNINPESEMKNGYFIDINTVEWWDKQPNQIKENLTLNQVSITTALNELYQFIEKDTILWCNKQFEANIFINAFKVEGIFCPINYKNFKDIDTLCYLGNVDSYKKVHDSKEDLHKNLERILTAYSNINQ